MAAATRWLAGGGRSIGSTALLVLVAIAVIAGVGINYLMKGSLRYEWLIVAVAGAFGAYFASESFPESYIFSGVTNWGPTVDGLYVIPALIGGILLALVADLGIRTGPEPRSA